MKYKNKLLTFCKKKSGLNVSPHPKPEKIFVPLKKLQTSFLLVLFEVSVHR